MLCEDDTKSRSDEDFTVRERDALASLLELSSTLEPVWVLAVVCGTCDPADVVVGVEGDTFFAVFLADELEAVVADEDGGCAALAGVSLHGFLDGEDGRATERGDKQEEG